MAETEQQFLFDTDEYVTWKEEWRDMPEFMQEDRTPWKSMPVHFKSKEDLIAFAKLVGQPITPETRSVWYPKAEIGQMSNKRFTDET